MSDLENKPADNSEGEKKPERWATVTKNRVIIWVLVGGFALYMIGTGVVGILTK